MAERPQKETPRKFRLVDDSDESWREFGRSDPYFGVLSVDQFRAENLTDETLKEFFDSGERHIAQLLDAVRDHVAPAPALGEALDFGCGVGRLVLPLAKRYRSVVGIDISDAYIAEAIRNRDRENQVNVTFAENLDGLMAAGRRFDLVHSCIVFNHISWPRGKQIISDLFDLLRDDGIMAVQVLHRRHAGPLRRGVSWVRRHFLPLHWVVNLTRGRSAFEPLMQGNEYPLDELLPFLSGRGARNFHIRIDPVPDGDSFAFIFCSKGPVPGPRA
jgi:SAM-dependent methyltransferase